MFEESFESGAKFSDCGKFRYALWRIWDKEKPLIMIIGLNPSKANATEPDPTIKSVGRLVKNNGFGGFYMMNCFPLISTNPEGLYPFRNTPFYDIEREYNDQYLITIKNYCKEVVFAWGKFDIVKNLCRDKELFEMFPGAKCFGHNKDGSPAHPLYLKSDTKLIEFKIND